MFVSASTECWPDLEYAEAVERLIDLDFAAVEVAIHEDGTLKPSELLEDEDRAIQLVRHTHRLDISGFDLKLGSTGEQHDKDFATICHLAKTIKVVTITVPSGPHGTPFNEEVERLKRLVEIGENEGIRVCVKCALDTLSDDPDTLMVLCNNIDGLGITLDPSVYIAGPAAGKSIDNILQYVCNVHLRDSRPDKFQVSVGQGEVDYGKIMSQLSRHHYKRALTIHMLPMKEHEHPVELRKLRRLIETML